MIRFLFSAYSQRKYFGNDERGKLLGFLMQEVYRFQAGTLQKCSLSILACSPNPTLLLRPE